VFAPSIVRRITDEARWRQFNKEVRLLGEVELLVRGSSPAAPVMRRATGRAIDASNFWFAVIASDATYDQFI
jgi:hypothetical protein